MTGSDRKGDTELNAYIDGELGDGAIVEIEDQLSKQNDDAALVRAYRQQSEDLHGLFDPVLEEAVPPEMADLVMNTSSGFRKSAWMQIAAAICLIIVGIAGGWGLRGLDDDVRISEMPSYVERAVGAHLVYAAEIRHPVEVVASEEKHLVAWLSKRLGHPLRTPNLGSLGYSLVGGRLLEESGLPAAQFMYEDNTGRRVTVYVRSYQGTDTAFKFFSAGNLSAFYWVDAPFAYALTGEMPRPDLLNAAHKVYEELALQ